MAGMLFSTPRTPEEEEKDLRQQAYEYARLTPEQQITMDSMRGNQMITRGVQRGVGGALGVDMRSPGEQRQQAEQAAQREIADLGIDANDIDRYYPAVIKILQKHGLQDATAAMVEKFRAHKKEQSELKLKQAEIDRKTQSDTNRYQTALRKIEVDQAKLDRMGPAALQMIREIEAMQRAASDLLDTDPRKEMIAARIESAKQALAVELAKNKFQLKDAGGKLVVFDTTTGETKDGPEKALDPNKGAAARAKAEKFDQNVKNQALGAIRQAKFDIDKAAQLYVHKGLPGITGPVYGRVPSISDDSTSAQALYDQVQAGTFLAALRALKGPENKPTGLGQLTEVEGAKIQSAMAALSRVQPTESFKTYLEQYIRQIEDSISVLATALEEQIDNTPVKLPAAQPNAAKKAAKVAPKPAPAPLPQKATPAPAGKEGPRVSVWDKDGREYTVPEANVERALARGYSRTKP